MHAWVEAYSSRGQAAARIEEALERHGVRLTLGDVTLDLRVGPTGPETSSA